MITLLKNLIPGRLALMAGVASAALAGGAYLVHVHDDNVRASVVASAQKAAEATIAADHDRAIAALQQAATDAAARAASSSNIRTRIHEAVPTAVCSSAPAIRAALSGLRQRTAARSGPAGSAGQP
jgi:hypothetical protein